MNSLSSKSTTANSQTDNALKPLISFSFADDVDVSLYASINDIDEDDWNDCLEENNIFLSSKYLAATEASLLPGLQFYYAVLKTQNHTNAVLYFQVVNLSDEGLGGVLNLEEYGGLAGGLSSKINDLLFSPGAGQKSYLLVCGNLLLSGDHGIRAVDEHFYSLAMEAITPIKKHIAHLLGNNNKLVAYMVKDFYPDINKIAAPLLKKEYFLLNTDPEMIFETNPEWNDFNDYLSSLSSKYRIRANQSRSKLEGLEMRHLPLDEIVKRQDELFELNHQVMRKAPVKLVKPSADYFINLKKAYDKHYQIKGFFLDGKLIAFTSALWNREHFEAHYIGIDYHYNRAHSLYQNILYSYISDVIECRSSRLYFGRTALEIKSTTGAKPHFIACYLRFANRLINTLARPLVSSTGPGDWVPRDPFRKQ